MMVLGPPLLVKKVQQDLEKAFTCKRKGEMTKYVGSKITITRNSTGLGTVKFMQPVLVCKLLEEYKPSAGPASKTPAIMGQVRIKGDGDGAVTEAQAKMCQSAAATCMYMMQWSHPNIFNAVHGLARHMTAPREAHVRALMVLIKYIMSTKNRGLVLLPKQHWSPEYKFKVHGQLDSDYATNPDNRRSISGGRVFVNGAHVLFHGATQKFVMLSVNEAKITAGVMAA